MVSLGATWQPAVKIERPRPLIDDVTRGFWDAARQHRFVIQRCDTCGKFRHPPAPMCPYCHSEEAAWQQVSGLGTIHQYTVMRKPRVPGFEAITPFACILVELDEQPGLLYLSNLVNAGPDAARIGVRVKVVFEDLDKEVVLPQFAPVETEGGPTASNQK